MRSRTYVRRARVRDDSLAHHTVRTLARMFALRKGRELTVFHTSGMKVKRRPGIIPKPFLTITAALEPSPSLNGYCPWIHSGD